MNRKTAILLVFTWLAISAFLQLRPLDDMDFFLQLRLGCEPGATTSTLFNGKEIAAEEPLNPGWLSQRFYCETYHLGGFRFIRLLHSLLFAGAFVLVGAVAVRTAPKSTRTFSLLFALALTLVCASSHSSVRAQGFSVAFFALTFALFYLPSFSFTRVAQLFVISVLWQNLHASLMLAIVLWVCFLPAYIFRPRRELVIFFLALPFLALAQLATPLGADVFSFASQNVDIARNLLGVSEWRPPFDHSAFSASLPFLIFCPLLLIGALPQRRALELQTLVAPLVFALLAFYSSRFILFWSITAVPLAITVFDSLLDRASATRQRGPFQTTPAQSPPSVFVALGITGLCLYALQFTPQFPLFSPKIPFPCIESLIDHGTKGTIYNYREWSGPIAFFGDPNWRTTIDGRLYLFPPEAWHSYAKDALGETSVQEIVETHSNSAFLLHEGFHEVLLKQLRENAQWLELVSDRTSRCAAFVPSPR